MNQSRAERGYTTRWDKAAATFRARRPWCLGCEAIGDSVPTELVDHVVPHNGNQDVFWDTALWQPCCRHHHDVVKRKLQAMYTAGEIAAAELWLDSATAKGISRQYPRAVAIGLDGWPID